MLYASSFLMSFLLQIMLAETCEWNRIISRGQENAVIMFKS